MNKILGHNIQQGVVQSAVAQVLSGRHAGLFRLVALALVWMPLVAQDKAAITLLSGGPSSVAPRGRLDIRVRVQNTGTRRWSPIAQTYQDSAFFVSVGIIDPANTSNYTGSVLPLTREVAPGESIEINGSVNAPDRAGQYTVAMTMLLAGSYRFADNGTLNNAAAELTVPARFSITVASTPTPTPNASGLTEGLVAYYKEDVSGSHPDAVANVNGTVTGTVGFTSSGKIGGASVFSGSETGNDGRVQSTLPNPQSWAGGTISTWVRPTVYNSGNLETIAQIREASGYGHLWLYINPLSRKFGFYAGTGQAQDTHAVGSTSVADNTWYHVAAVWDKTSNTAALYVNGSREATISVPRWGQTSTGFYWGAGFNGYGMRGNIDEIGVWNRPLSAAGIASLFNSGAGLAHPFQTAPACEHPELRTEPQDQSFRSGQQVRLSVAATGTGLSYRWYEGESGDGRRPVGMGDSITVRPTATTRYWVLVSNSCGNAASRTVTLTLLEAPWLLSPQSGTTLPSDGVLFTWSAGSGIDAYRLFLESQRGRGDLFASPVQTQTSVLIPTLPADGRTIYMRLCYRIGESWPSSCVEGEFKASTVAGDLTAKISSPSPNSILRSKKVTFHWTDGRNASQYVLYVGSKPGASDYASVDAKTALFSTVNDLPADGGLLYVRLWSHLGKGWEYEDYTYTAYSSDSVPDLEVVEIRHELGDPSQVGSTVSINLGITATVKNQGDSPSGWILVRFYSSKLPTVTTDSEPPQIRDVFNRLMPTECIIESIPPGRTGECSVGATGTDYTSLWPGTGYGVVYFGAVASLTDGSIEEQLANNSKVSEPMVRPRPNPPAEQRAPFNSTSWDYYENSGYAIDLEFGKESNIAAGDKLHIEDAAGNAIAASPLTGDDLAGRTYRVPGALARLRLETQVPARSATRFQVESHQVEDRPMLPPSELQVEGAGEGSVTATWRPNDETVDEYELVVRFPSGTEGTKRVSADHTSFTFNEMQSGDTCSFWVRAIRKDGWLFWSEEVKSVWSKRVTIRIP